MIKWMLFAAAVFLAATTANAQTPGAQAPPSPSVQAPTDPAATEAARRLMAATHADRNLGAAIDQMLPAMMRDMAREHGLTSAQTATATTIVTQEAHASAGDLLDVIAALYVRHFSAADMDALAAFYESPVGQRYTDQIPTLLSESISLGRAWGLNVLAPRVEARVEALLHQGQLQP